MIEHTRHADPTVGGPSIARSSGDGDPPVVSSAGCGPGYATNPRVDSH
ncbi:hypothetical protein Asp14428_74330 [Actinoplanes sp. NBRC 14428]|nr:hypothetical protein Asp14428_74330 [Actinoplanes sp. NBRC 14428]